MSQAAAEPRYTQTGRWLAQRRLKIAIVIAAPIIVFYIFAGRGLESDTGRQIAWIAAASQAFAVLLVILAFVIGLLALIFVGIFAAVALFLLLTDKPDRPART